jgi:hypothetical protein
LHEASLHIFNSFITLTYDPEHLPEDGSLNVLHFQKFMKRLRKKSRLKGKVANKAVTFTPTLSQNI